MYKADSPAGPTGDPTTRGWRLSQGDVVSSKVHNENSAAMFMDGETEANCSGPCSLGDLELSLMPGTGLQSLLLETDAQESEAEHSR